MIVLGHGPIWWLCLAGLVWIAGAVVLAPLIGRGIRTADLNTPAPEFQEDLVTSTPGTPADVGPGCVCRIRLGGGVVYSTPRLTLVQAKETADGVTDALSHGHGRYGQLISFPAENALEVKVAAEQIKAIEIVRVVPVLPELSVTIAGDPTVAEDQAARIQDHLTRLAEAGL